MATKKQVKKAKQRAKPALKAQQKEKKASPRLTTAAKKAAKPRGARTRTRGRANAAELVGYQPRGLGALTAGQAGDTQGISAALRANSESVEELLEEGQTFEAEAIAGVENAPDPDESEVVTHEIPEDDVPEEYRERE